MCRVGQAREAVRQPRIAMDVEQGCAYALSVQGACKYHPPIVQTVPQHCSDALPSMACHLWGAPQDNISSVSYDLHGLLKDMGTLA